MKKILVIILILFCGKTFSQQLTQSIMTDLHLRVKDKNLQKQMIKHEKIISDIFLILNSERNASAYLEEKMKKEADQLRKEQNLKSDQPVLLDTRLNHQDSIQLKLIDQEVNLLQKYRAFRDAFSFNDISKLNKEDQYWNDFFYKEHINSIDKSYKIFFENKKKIKSKYEKQALYSTNWKIPTLYGCEENKEMATEECFSKKIRTAIESTYQVPNFINYDFPINIKNRVLFRITKDGTYEALEIAQTSEKYFLDMLSLDIMNRLFKNKKIANSQEEDFYSKVPLTYNFE